MAGVIVLRITSERRNYRRQLARDAAALAQHPSRDVKQPECHEIWLSSTSSSLQWQNIRVGLQGCLLDTDELIAFLSLIYSAYICRNHLTYPVCTCAGQITQSLVNGERHSSYSTFSRTSELLVSVNNLTPAFHFAKSPFLRKTRGKRQASERK